MDKSKRFKQVIIQLVILVAGIMIMHSLLYGMSVISNLKQQKADNKTELNLMVNKIAEADTTRKENLTSFDSSAAARGKTIAYYLNTHANGQRDLNGLATEWRLKGYALFDEDGNIEVASNIDVELDSEEIQTLLANGQPVTIENSRYYLVKLNQGKVFVFSRNFASEQRQLDTYYSISTVLSTLNADSANTVTAVNLETNRIAYSKNTYLISADAKDAGYDTSIITDGYSGTMTINGEKVYVSAMESNGVLLITSRNYEEIVNRSSMTINLILVVFVIVIDLLIAYSDFIRMDLIKHPEKPNKRKKLPLGLYYDPFIGKKIRAVIFIGLAALLVITYYLETLGPLSRQGTLSEDWLTSVETILNKDEEDSNRLIKEYNSDYTLLAQHIAYTLSLDPTMINHDTLSAMATAANIKSIYVFDENGNAVGISEQYRNFSLNTDPESQSYAFWTVVNGNSLSYVQDAGYDELGDYMQYIGVQRQDANGMVQIGVNPSMLETRLASTGLQSTLTGTSIGQNGFLFAVNAETGAFSANSDSTLIGRQATASGLKETALSDGYSGFQTVSGVSCFVTSFLYQNTDYVYVAFPLSVIYSERFPGAIAVKIGRASCRERV